MFSALKSKLTNSSPNAATNDKVQAEAAANHHGINSMNAALQRKFAHGVNYNLKLYY